MRVIIIEDEKPAARLLQRKLDRLGIAVDVMLHSVQEAMQWFSSNTHPDLIFLDIQLSDGLSFEIFENMKIDSPVIFTTAYDEYALRAFKLNSIDYLLKPIDEDDLEAAINKFKSRLPRESNSGINIDMIKQLFVSNSQPAYKERFSIKVGEHIKVFSVEDVEVIYSENKGTYIATNEGRSYLIDSTLEQVEKEINPKNFFRVNRTFLVAMSAIKDIVVYSNSRLKLTLKSYNKEEIIVSRERVGEFREWLG
jgi:two-component system, LytTR family, response regulator LytT